LASLPVAVSKLILDVGSSTGGYRVAIGHGAFAALLRRHEDSAVIADSRFRDLVDGRGATFVVARESNKTIAETARVLEELNGLGVRRGTTIIALGGGIVQDLATLAASLYMRGLSWSYAPTTLAAMADSCIGGKSSINVGAVKNLAGNFHPPQEVAIDPGFIATLAPVDIVNGLAEAAKIAYCRGREAYLRYEQLAEAFDKGADVDAAIPLLAHVLGCKTWFIQVDEFDRAERRLLNLGHTFGHALETAVGHRVQHGVAVALGVRAATVVARQEDGSAEGLRERLDAHCARLVEEVPGVGGALAHFDPTLFDRAIRADKKHTATELRLILPDPDGGAREVGMPQTRANGERLRLAIEVVLDQVR
jgi:3-dehydroquinate synthase